MIVFEKLTFQNFLSVGNVPVTINLNDKKTTLIHGTNGSGKSTVLDALTYVLFNKPFRSVNLPQLINSSNKKGLMVEVEFCIGNTKFNVERGIKPKVFNIYRDGELLDAKAADKDNQKYLETNILKMNLKTFIQVVILGSSNYMPFMQLSAPARRDCVEDFLDMKVFTTMSILAKERLKGIKDELNQNKGELSNLEYKIDLQRDRIREIEDRSESDIEELHSEIHSLKNLLSEHNTKFKLLQEEDEKTLQEVRKLMINSPKKVHKEYNNVIIKLDSKLERLKKELDFYQNNDECPTCTQTIDESIKTNIKDKTIEESKKIITARSQANDKFQEVQKIIDQILEKEEKAYTIQQKIYQLQTSIDHCQKEILHKENKIITISNSKTGVQKEKGKLEALNEQLQELEVKKNENITRAHQHDIVVGLLKDSGIKTQIVRKYLPVMNNLIRKYLTDLELPILFSLDDEFGEKVSSPMYQDFSYGSFSEGQTSRIDLALMFTWREIGKMKNSVSTNILILDEVFSSSLDDVGKENLLALLRYGLEDNQRVLVVDHTLNNSFKEKFDHTIEVSKLKGFSKYNSSTENIG